jgi:hypothetical protein
MNLVGQTCMQECEVSIQVSSWIGLKIKIIFEFEIQTKPSLYSIKLLQIHGEGTAEYYSCYNETRGVTHTHLEALASRPTLVAGRVRTERSSFWCESAALD